MSIENIIKKIESETKTKINEILNDAQSKAREYKSGANKRLSDRLDQIREQGEKKITIMRNIHLSEARRAARKNILGAKEELIEECFRQARDKLQTITGEEYRKVMLGLIKESLALVGGSGVATLTRSEDKAILTSFPDITVKPDLASGLGGLILRSADGKIVVDNTFDAILERKKEDIRTEVANILFPEIIEFDEE